MLCRLSCEGNERTKSFAGFIIFRHSNLKFVFVGFLGILFLTDDSQRISTIIYCCPNYPLSVMEYTILSNSYISGCMSRSESLAMSIVINSFCLLVCSTYISLNFWCLMICSLPFIAGACSNHNGNSDWIVIILMKAHMFLFAIVSMSNNYTKLYIGDILRNANFSKHAHR